MAAVLSACLYQTIAEQVQNAACKEGAPGQPPGAMHHGYGMVKDYNFIIS